ncbi:MAG: hypothetical protein KAS32_19760 [Candidatus Peribacteraceae bacterium]|nr:hypothetical protein [Candidatus Peribacteraceae bacterium]
MKKGISSPMRENGKGGLHLATSDEHILTLLGISLSPCDSSNPFQQLGFKEAVTFNLADEMTFAGLKVDVQDIMKHFEEEELATLQNRSDNLSVVQTADGEYGMAIHIINLQKNSKFSATVRAGSAGWTVG